MKAGSGYNGYMQRKKDIMSLLRVASVLWVAYLAISAAIEYTLKSPGPTERYIYVGDGVISLFFFGVTFWPWIQKRLDRIFLPVMIFLVCALPIIVNQVAIPHLFPGPLPAPGTLLASVVPFLLIALILIAWQYGWRYVLAFSLGVALLNIVLLVVFYPYKQEPFSAGLFAILNQVVIFLVVGFFINVVVGWLNTERRGLEEANVKLSNYSKTLEDLTVSRERNRIAQELHDTLSHTLSGLSLQLETMKAYWDIEPSTARKVLDRSLAATRSGLEETRRVLMALRARPLEEMGLVAAVRQIAEDASSAGSLTLELRISDNLAPLSLDIEQSIYRVAQEAVTNVLKHASATKLIVALEQDGEKVKLTIEDNGAGFDPTSAEQGKHFGLLGMRERAGAARGKLDVESRLGKGTKVQLTI